MRISMLLALWGLATLAYSQSNPPAPGFRAEASDAKAIALADQAMEAMGGRTAWDNTRFLHWNFLGFRTLTWDRYTGRVRIESPRDSMVYLINVHSGEGRVAKAGVEINDPEAKAKAIQRARSIWINDSYWLIMPFKLKDSGVALTYKGAGTTSQGEAAEVVELTFKEVGDTPQNKYLVYFDPETKLVSQWDYFANAEDETPGFQLPWQNYEQHGEILLTGDHGPRQLTEIAVMETVPDSVFTAW